ncbi:MAG TPA: TetR/AcrR family transcriptional regulator [Cellulomonadaceae bacterium]|nr:TetR/AcrR family transcriptional regulator [Cellulomonadaceae bacterium]
MPSPAVSRIGRPRQFDVDELVATTLQLFWSNGYRNTSTRDLEGALGVTQSSLYHAFGSKAGLLDAVLDRYQEAVDTSLLEPLRDAPDGSAGLATFLRGLGTWMAADGRGCLMVNLMVDEAPTNTAIATRTAAHRERLRAALRVAVEKVSGSGGTETVDRRTDLLLAATLGLNLAARAGASATELARIIAGVDAEVASWSTP